MDIVDIKSAPIKVMTDAYRKSLGADDTNNMFDIAYQWQDKPHRHVWDLCKRLDEAADEIERLRQQNAELVEEPSIKMLLAGKKALFRVVEDPTIDDARSVYEAMIAACKATGGE